MYRYTGDISTGISDSAFHQNVANNNGVTLTTATSDICNLGFDSYIRVLCCRALCVRFLLLKY